MSGAFSSYRLAGPPERIIPRGFSARIFSGAKLNGWISQYTLASRTRRAMSCVYWLPKSRIRITKSDLAINYTEATAGGETHAARAFPQRTRHAPRADSLLPFLRRLLRGVLR